MENRVVAFRKPLPCISQPFTACVDVSVPLSGITPTSTIPCMGTATPSTTTAAACGPPHCLASITVGERRSRRVQRTAQPCVPKELRARCCAWHWWWQIAARLCLTQALFSRMRRWLSLPAAPLTCRPSVSACSLCSLPSLNLCWPFLKSPVDL